MEDTHLKRFIFALRTHINWINLALRITAGASGTVVPSCDVDSSISNESNLVSCSSSKIESSSWIEARAISRVEVEIFNHVVGGARIASRVPQTCDSNVGTT